jgi:molybdenum cofactor cytidylyltransferase
LTGKRSLLVLGAQWREVLQACEPLDGFFAVNGRFAEGMGTSIALAGALLRPVADGMLILLADQPLIVESHLRQLQARWLQEPSGIVATRFGGVSGPPVIFPGRCIAALCELDGDRGAREILQREVSSCISIRFEDAATDIDTREDLQRLQ